MGAEIPTAAADATTHAGGRRGRHIDYFVVSRSIVAIGPKTPSRSVAIIRTHDAVRMRILVAPRQFAIGLMVRAAVFPPGTGNRAEAHHGDNRRSGERCEGGTCFRRNW